ncbi:MFS transporter [Pseudomonas sp. 6D_7.1_Bac1]|uniref:MFS transporter n=1 Tax=Pseudomonas sp. 6D_7.1_Bac1 TaxID=2971615 RepID=UPI0021C9A323|nr:MFS transporter [Pseudomonas sp. 6D_7.1_Bac1]MCU1747863.1 MFS transporter [Pseudomonas sp. 6D_7.1_Bac1]
MLNPLIKIGSFRALGFCLAITLFELLTYMASDMIMPAMVTVTDDLNASANHIPSAFNLYLLGGVLLQWLIGPLADSFGRRKALLMGCAAFAVTCGMTVWVQSIFAFNLLRLLQGMGLGFVIAVSYPALQEVFCEADAVRIMAVLGNLALLSPLLGPLAGSLMLKWISWRELFLMLGVLGTLVWLALYWVMPETIGVLRQDGTRLNPTPFRLRTIALRYIALLKNRRFLCASVALGLMSLPLIAWIGLSPLLLIQGQGLSVLEYGLWQVPVFAAVIIGNLVLNLMIARTRLEGLIQRALWPFCAGLLLLIIASRFSLSIPVLVSGLMLYGIGLGMSNAALYRAALFTSDDSKGLVSAMVGMISIALMAGAGSVIAALGAGEAPGYFALTVGIAGLLALLPLRWFLLPAGPALPI